MTKPKEAGLDLDAVLVELGSFGRYQIRTYCLILLPIVLSGAYNGQYIFAAGETPYRCMVPECESAPVEWEPDVWSEWALSKDQCERARPLDGFCGPESFSPNYTTKCTAFVYEHNNTIVSEFDLACQEWKRTLVGTVHSFGIFSALFITGFLSDTYGRRITFIMTASLRAFGGLVRAFSNNYVTYVVFEYIDAVISSGVYSTGFILALEMVSLKRRVLGGSMLSGSFAVGQMLLALIAWQIPYWRTLTLVLYAPAILFLLYFFCIEESVRWLLSTGDKKEAARIIFKAADVNNTPLSPHTIKMLVEEPRPVPVSTKEAFGPPPPHRSLAKEVIGSRIMMSRLGICSFWWITVTFIYYGLSINSVSLGGNKYLNYVLTSLVELPGYCISIMTLDRFGRKSSIMTSLFICGTSLFALPFVPATVVWARMCLNLLGKLFVSMVISSIYIYTTEMFPTLVRHRVLAFCCMCGRVGEMLAPQTPLLMKYMRSLPYLIFGVMAGCAGALMLLTPETLRMRLPDTVAEAENMAGAPHVRHARTDIISDKYKPTTNS